jgi:hypothetical protein
MKKFLLSLMIILISVNVFAHHLDTKGWCSLSTGKAVFQTVLFNNNLNVEIQYKPFNASGNNDPWLLASSFNTRTTGNTDTLILIVQPVQNQVIKVRFRYKATNSNNWGSWSSSQNSSTSPYAGCGFLPVKFIYFNVEALSRTYTRWYPAKPSLHRIHNH